MEGWEEKGKKQTSLQLGTRSFPFEAITQASVGLSPKVPYHLISLFLCTDLSY